MFEYVFVYLLIRDVRRTAVEFSECKSRIYCAHGNSVCLDQETADVSTEGTEILCAFICRPADLMELPILEDSLLSFLVLFK